MSTPNKTIAACILVTLLASQRHAGFILIYVLPFFLMPWFAYSGYVVVRRKETRKLQIVKLMAWLIGVSVASCIQAYMYFSTKNDAAQLSAAVESYIAAKGKCPETIQDVGFQMTEDRMHRRLASYDCIDGVPNIWYYSTFVAFDMEEYDFSNHRWVHTDVDL
jgi:hypothetical protein